MMSRIAAKGSLVLIGAVLMVPVWAQESLSLDSALEMAKSKNGDVRAAYLNLEAAKKGEVSAYSAFLPTVTPSLSREWSRNETFTGPGRGGRDTSFSSALIDANWQLLDNGSRGLSLRRARANADATGFSALQTLRNTLFTVHTRFFESLRTTKLLEVQAENVNRAKAILDETEVRTKPPVEDLPRKDLFQARADYQNALVSQLTAKNRVTTANANLKAILGWEDSKLPELVDVEDVEGGSLVSDLETAVREGLENRPDLLASRRRIYSQEANVEAAKLDGGVRYSVDANFRRGFAEDPFQRTALVLSASVPLYDGQRTRANVAAERASLEALREGLTQQERDVAAEIEAAYLEVSQNMERLDAAKLAKEAAQVNYDLTQEAYSKFRAATLLERLTAQLTLTTAESNLVEARYDLLISKIRLDLAMGRTLPGE